MSIRATLELFTLFTVLIGASAAPLTAQEGAEGRVVGRVIDMETGRGLPGAQITVEGTPLGVLAGVDGRYILQRVPAGTVSVRVEMIGFGTKTVSGVDVPRGGAAEANVSLETSALLMDEIVVTGTAAGALARQIPHSVGRIDPSRIDEPIANVDQLLTGRLPGVTVQQSSGNSGSGSQIRLRGNASAALSNEPLGLPISSGAKRWRNGRSSWTNGLPARTLRSSARSGNSSAWTARTSPPFSASAA